MKAISQKTFTLRRKPKDGISFNFRGEYSPHALYVKNDVVRYKGKLYIAVYPNKFAGSCPEDNSYGYWNIFLEDGKEVGPTYSLTPIIENNYIEINVKGENATMRQVTNCAYEVFIYENGERVFIDGNKDYSFVCSYNSSSGYNGTFSVKGNLLVLKLNKSNIKTTESLSDLEITILRKDRSVFKRSVPVAISPQSVFNNTIDTLSSVKINQESISKLTQTAEGFTNEVSNIKRNIGRLLYGWEIDLRDKKFDRNTFYIVTFPESYEPKNYRFEARLSDGWMDQNKTPYQKHRQGVNVDFSFTLGGSSWGARTHDLSKRIFIQKYGQNFITNDEPVIAFPCKDGVIFDDSRLSDAIFYIRGGMRLNFRSDDENAEPTIHQGEYVPRRGLESPFPNKLVPLRLGSNELMKPVSYEDETSSRITQTAEKIELVANKVNINDTIFTKGGKLKTKYIDVDELKVKHLDSATGNIENAILKNVAINGSLISPFKVYDEELVYGSDYFMSPKMFVENNNIIFLTEGTKNSYYVLPRVMLPQDLELSGYRGVLVNSTRHMQNSEFKSGAIRFQGMGKTSVTQPNGKSDSVFELGANEGIEVIAIADEKLGRLNWQILNHFSIKSENPKPTLVATGTVNERGELIRSWGTKVSVTRERAGRYQVYFLNRMDLGRASEYYVSVSGNEHGVHHYACVIVRSSDGFKVYTGDDASPNDGGFDFFVYA